MRRRPGLWITAALMLVCLSGADARAAESSAPSASSPGADPEVIVRSSREALAPQVSKWVGQITALENEEGVPRWWQPVCPTVTGLSRQQGEFILERLSQIAREAGVPLAGESCHPNLFIFVTQQPGALLQAMAAHHREVTFGDASPLVVNAFIAQSRPVKTWYLSNMKTPEGKPLITGAPMMAQILGGGLSAPPTFNDWDRTSHLMSMTIWTFSYVYVVADESQLRGVSRGQFADYVSMVGLADIKPNAHLGEAPTLLKLFDGAPQAAPPGMTDWDQAFLKAVYSTEQSSRTQRKQIASAMVRDIVR